MSGEKQTAKRSKLQWSDLLKSRETSEVVDG